MRFRYLAFFLLTMSALCPAQTTQVVDSASGTRSATENFASIDNAQRGNGVFASQCRAVVSIDAFCKCLAGRIPQGVSFEQYVVMLSRDKQAVGYDAMPAAGRRFYDGLPAVRDSCAVAREP